MYEKSPSRPIVLNTAVLQERHVDRHTDGHADKPTAMPQIESAVTRLASLAHSLEAKTESLEGRLHPVLRSLGPCTGDAKECRENSAPLAEELFRIADSIERSLSAIAALEDRIEL